jgi:hypothetical protein
MKSAKAKKESKNNPKQDDALGESNVLAAKRFKTHFQELTDTNERGPACIRTAKLSTIEIPHKNAVTIRKSARCCMHTPSEARQCQARGR